ncbi:MAG: Cro/CI family transcriptional regulator [Cycloclasticus sp.]|jgi:hypothetical protein
MTKAETIKFFGNASKLAKAMNVTKAAISLWGEYPPYPRQFQIQVLTKGTLKAEDAK